MRRNHETKLEDTAIYAAGYVSGWLAYFAFAHDLPTAFLTNRVADLLHPGGTSGSTDTVLPLPEAATHADERVSTLALAGDARGRGPSSPTRGAARNSRKLSASVHWTQRPENRERMQKHLAKMRKLRKSKLGF